MQHQNSPDHALLPCTAQREFAPDPDYFTNKQTVMTPHMRSILVDWMISVAEEFRLYSDTLYSSVSLMDRFLSVEEVTMRELQLVGITCMWIVAKFEEPKEWVPSAEKMSWITDHTYSTEQVRPLVLGVTQYNINAPAFAASCPGTSLHIV